MTQPKLMKQRKFYPLFWTQFFGAFNDNFLKNAMVILITYRVTEVAGIPASQMVAVAGGIFILPFFLFSATAGQLADKYEKTKIIRFIKLAEIGIMAIASVGFLTHQYTLLLFVLFLIGLHSTFFGPIKYSILPQHLSNDELVAGNALVEAGTFIAILLGTIIGGVLISQGDQGAIFVSLGLLGVAVIGYLFSRLIPIAPALAPQMKIQWNPITPSLEIYRFTKKNRTVFLSVIGISWFWFFGASMLSLFPPFCKEVLQTDSSVVTLFLAVFSVGIALGSLLFERLSRHGLELGLVPIGSIGISFFTFLLFLFGTPQDFPIGLTALQFAQNPSGVLILGALLFLSVFSGFFIVPLYTLILERSEPSQRSRVVAGNNILNALFMVIASVSLVVMMSLKLSIPQIFLVLALVNALASIYVYFLLPTFFYRFLLWILANVMYRLRVKGRENIPTHGPALLIANHVSFVDWMFIASASQRPPRFVMDFNYIRGSFLKKLLKQSGVIPIATSKEDPAILKAAFEEVSKALHRGDLVCIFPEGVITYDGHLAPFKPGVEKILAANPVPVIPMAIGGMWGSYFSRKDGNPRLRIPKRFWSRVELNIGKPVSPLILKAEGLRSEVASLLNSYSPK
jgi:1-acyl-sn-glycerol-3-phosphate acyltransferase